MQYDQSVKKKILILIPCLLQGGTEMQTLNLAKILISLKFEVQILSYFEYERSIVKTFNDNGIETRMLNLDRKIGVIKFVNNLRKEITCFNPDIVHVQYMAPGALPILAAKLAGVKRVFALVHQPWTKAHGIKAKILLRAASFLTTRFLTVSLNAEKSWFRSSSLFDDIKPPYQWKKHFTIYNSVDVARIKEICGKIDIKAIKRELAIPANSAVIATVSRLRHEKGIDMLIDSFISLKKECHNIHLLIVGSGPDEKKLKQKVLDNKCQGAVTFSGAAEWHKAIGLMSMSDILVVPSRFEGFGLAAAEAMAAAKPVIASDAFGLREVVDHEVTGLIFKTNDSDALTAAMRQFVLNPELRKSYGNRGYSKVKTQFDMATLIDKVRILYNMK
jgi:glycosyltransferase involved in cell wall biosynthesis